MAHTQLELFIRLPEVRQRGVIVKCGVWQHDQAALFCCSKVA